MSVTQSVQPGDFVKSLHSSEHNQIVKVLTVLSSGSLICLNELGQDFILSASEYQPYLRQGETPTAACDLDSVCCSVSTQFEQSQIFTANEFDSVALINVLDKLIHWFKTCPFQRSAIERQALFDMAVSSISAEFSLTPPLVKNYFYRVANVLDVQLKGV